MNKILLATIVAIIAVGVTAAYAAIDLKDDTTVTGNLAVTGDITGPTITALTTSIDSAAICPRQNIEHWDKIIYSPLLTIPDINFNTPQGQPDLIEDRDYDVKVIDDPNKNVDLSQVVANKLNQLGYDKLTLNQPAIEDIHPDNIVIVDVEYTIVCVEPPIG